MAFDNVLCALNIAKHRIDDGVYDDIPSCSWTFRQLIIGNDYRNYSEN